MSGLKPHGSDEAQRAEAQVVDGPIFNGRVNIYLFRGNVHGRGHVAGVQDGGPAEFGVGMVTAPIQAAGDVLGAGVSILR